MITFLGGRDTFSKNPLVFTRNIYRSLENSPKKETFKASFKYSRNLLGKFYTFLIYFKQFDPLVQKISFPNKKETANKLLGPKNGPRG